MVVAPLSLHEDPGQHAVVNVPPAFKYCSEIIIFFYHKKDTLIIMKPW